ncbi:vacuolar protein sorting 29, partial [Cystoisospora suis]
DFRIGLIHGHQIVPWGDGGSLLHWQRKLDCDILVYGHLHKDSVIELEGKFFINPGSATGAYQPWITEKVPSFMLMAVQGSSVVLYVYEEKGGKAEVVMSEFKKESSSSSTAHATSSSSSSAMGDMNSNSSSSMNNSSSSSHSTSNGSASSSIHH